MSDRNTPQHESIAPISNEQWQKATLNERLAYVRAGGEVTATQSQDLLRMIDDDLCSESSYLLTRLQIITNGKAESPDAPVADAKLLQRWAALGLWRNETVIDAIAAWREVEEVFSPDEAAKLMRYKRREITETRRELQARLKELKEIRKLAVRLAKPALDGRLAAQTVTERSHINVQNSGTYQVLRETIAANNFKADAATLLPTSYFDRYNSKGKAEMKPLDNESGDIETLVRSMWEHCRELKDFDVDIMDALNTLWIEQAKTPDSNAVAFIDDLLRLRCITPRLSGQGRRGGFRDDDRAKIIASVARLQRIWLDAAETTKRGKSKKTFLAQSRVLTVSDRIVQTRLEGEPDTLALVYRPGSIFSHFLFGPGRQTALLSAKALHYHAYHELIEKRLTRYLSYIWRVRGRRASYTQPLAVKTLFEGCNLQAQKRNAYKTRERFEKALDRLEQDKVIATWQYEAQSWTSEDEANSSFMGWLAKAHVVIEPPDIIKNHYQQMYLAPATNLISSLPPAKNAQTDNTPLDVRVKAQRIALGLSQMQAAEQIGISQKSLSNLENGHGMSATTRKMITSWLKEFEIPATSAPDSGDL